MKYRFIIGNETIKWKNTINFTRSNHKQSLFDVFHLSNHLVLNSNFPLKSSNLTESSTLQFLLFIVEFDKTR